MENELVRYSRAGDVFHYRWAARRCLRMLHPKSSVKHIVIEGSKENAVAGEYVIDVAEYAENVEESCEDITYFQLKHSTQRVNEPFNLSDLKDTIEGFAKRFSALFDEDRDAHQSKSVRFSIVTNRQIADSFKAGVLDIRDGEQPDKQF